MRRILRYLLAVMSFGIIVSSCNWYSDPLELVYPGTDLSGKQEEDVDNEIEKIITDFENVLSSVWNGGWKISGTSDQGDEVSVYYIFDTEAGTFQTKSTSNTKIKNGEYKLSVNDEKKIQFSLTNSDLKLLGDETLTVKEVSEGKVLCLGNETGKNYEMVNASQAEIDDVADELMKNIKKCGLNYGVVRKQDGTFKAYYYLDDSNINFVSFDKGQKKVVRASIPYIKDGSDKYVWESAFTIGNAAITGISYNEETESVALVGLDADADLKLVQNISVDKEGNAIPMKEWLTKKTIEFKEAALIASADLQEECDNVQFNIFEWNGSYTSIVIYYNNFYFLEYNVPSEMFPIEGTDILQITGKLMPGYGSDIKEVSTNYPKIYNFLVEQNHIVVRDGEAKNSPLLLLSISSDQFIYWPNAKV